MIVCDCDGCILDLSKSFSQWWNKRHPDIKIDENPSDWYFGLKDGLIDLLYSEMVEGFLKSDNISKLPYYSEDTEEYFNKLSSKFDIDIVTSCSASSSDNRIKNLSNLKYKSLIFKEEHKERFIVYKLKPTIVIEDKPTLVKFFSEVGITVFYPDWNYTKGLSEFGTVFYNWKDLYQKIKSGGYF